MAPHNPKRVKRQIDSACEILLNSLPPGHIARERMMDMLTEALTPKAAVIPPEIEKLGKEGLEFYKLSVTKLKKHLKERGCPVSGAKVNLVIRLVEFDTVHGKENKAGLEKIHEKLKKLGITDPERVSDCVKAGIMNGKVKLSGKEPLDNHLVTDKCPECSSSITVTLRDVLYQSDCGGDYEEGGEGSSVKCSDDCPGIYITDICKGKPAFDSGKFFNHCSVCPAFGECIHDYRNAHCYNCQEHFFMGLTGFNCEHCGEGDNDSDEYDY